MSFICGQDGGTVNELSLYCFLAYLLICLSRDDYSFANNFPDPPSLSEAQAPVMGFKGSLRRLFGVVST